MPYEDKEKIKIAEEKIREDLKNKNDGILNENGNQDLTPSLDEVNKDIGETEIKNEEIEKRSKR